MSGNLISIETMRYPLVLFGLAYGLASITASILPAGLDWSWSPWRDIASIILMLFAGLVLFLLQPLLDAIDVRIMPYCVAGAALAAGAVFLFEPAIVGMLRPLVDHRPLPSLVFALSSGSLAAAFAFCTSRRKAAIALEQRSEFLAFLRNGGIYAGIFVGLFVVHGIWLDGIALFTRAITRDDSINLVAMLLQTLVPLLTIGAVVGYCFNSALSDPVARRSAITRFIPDALPAHDYVWADYAPRRPFRTQFEERNLKIMPVVLIFGLTGLVAGYTVWPQQWFGSALSCGLLGLFATGGYAGIIYRAYRHTDLESPVTTSVIRRAFIRESSGQLEFVVLEENGTPSGNIQVQRPWSEIVEFSKDSYGAAFGMTHARPFKIDWNVVKLVPSRGAPLLVAETLDGDAGVYEIMSELTRLFGAKAYDDYLRSLQKPQDVERSGSVPSEL